jgi:hypothetical protein
MEAFFAGVGFFLNRLGKHSLKSSGYKKYGSLIADAIGVFSGRGSGHASGEDVERASGPTSLPRIG